MPRRPTTDEASQLTPLMFQVLVALTQGEQHGYGIMREIEERSAGEFTIGAGSMYRALKQLVDAGLVSEVASPPGSHRQRRTYRITAAGRRRAAAEARVLAGIVDWARGADLLRGYRP